MPHAPIALFVYNRPRHTRKALESLKACKGAAESVLYIFADGRREGATVDERQNILAVRALIREEQWCGRVEIVEADKNKGLAQSIIGGVTQVVGQYGKIIVLEDDLLLHPDFLTYMNAALDKYETDGKIYSVTGYQFPVRFSKDVPSTFFFDDISSWSWGTWKRAWQHFDPAGTGWEQMKTDGELRSRFNFGNSTDYYGMMVSQMETKQINSWAIRWYWSVFKQGGLNLYPKHTLVQNIGFDGTGVHGADNDSNFSTLHQGSFSPVFPAAVQQNEKAAKQLTAFWRMQNRHDLLTRVRRRLHRLFR